MKELGITRKIDDLGRIAIPKEIRRSLHWMGGDELEICATEDGVFVRRPRSEGVSSKLERVKAETADSEDLTAEQINHINNALQEIIDYCASL